MKLLPLDKLGPRQLSTHRVRFGLFLPWVSAAHGNRLRVKLIHEKDQFLQAVSPRSFDLSHSVDPDYGDYWSGDVDIVRDDGPSSESAWGEEGTYVYRFELESPLLPSHPGRRLDWIVDPFAREFGVGRQAAFTLGYEPHVWGPVESTWKTPELEDLVAYEIQLHEFAGGLEGALERLPYLRDLGMNCIEIMPVANVERTVDWGFEPIGLFGVDERFGNRRDVQQFIEAAHAHGIAVVLDMIYGHTGRMFPYEYVYSRLGYHENPFMGAFAADMFGPSSDWNRSFVRDFYFTVNRFWLDRFHVDGIRYDCVPNYWDGCLGLGYAHLVYDTYETVKGTAGAGHWQRFFRNGRVNLIQCAEQLERPVEVVEKTYTTCTWQNETLSAAAGVAAGCAREDFGRLTDLGHRLGLADYPEEAVHNGEVIRKSALQYLENHDHPRFICRFGTRSLYREVLREGLRENWYRIQPYLIGLLLGKGIPMLWQGQEIVEKYDVPDSGPARIGTLRPVRWELFYDPAGRGMTGLIRKLLALRESESIFRRGEHHFHNHWDRWQSRGLLLFSRWDDRKYALIALNFTDEHKDTEFWFPRSGDYQEALHGERTLVGVRAMQPTAIRVPSNYGRVWIQ